MVGVLGKVMRGHQSRLHQQVGHLEGPGFGGGAWLVGAGPAPQSSQHSAGRQCWQVPTIRSRGAGGSMIHGRADASLHQRAES